MDHDTGLKALDEIALAAALFVACYALSLNCECKAPLSARSLQAKHGIQQHMQHMTLSRHVHQTISKSLCMLYRSQYHPMVVNEPWIRFYAGAPIVTSSGFRIGSV